MPAAQALEPGHNGYPERLNDLDDPPKRIHVRGAIPTAPAVAIVGAREADRDALRFARSLAEDLGRAGVTVVSGGARGIDQAAHLGALEGGGRTVMVLGCGLDVDYPSGSRELRRRVERSGAVVSELAHDARPHPANFPRRNRIVAALSGAVVVVQAGERSGALITARLAAELGRPVMAVPGRPGAAATRGTHGLLRRGALFAEGAEDVLEVLGVRAPDDEGLRVAPRVANLSGLQAAVARWLRRGPATADEVARGLERPVSDILSTLVQLEVEGVITVSGGSYELIVDVRFSKRDPIRDRARGPERSQVDG